MLTRLADHQRVHRFTVTGLERATPPDISVRSQSRVTAGWVPIGVQQVRGRARGGDIQHLDERRRSRRGGVSVALLQTAHVTDRHRRIDGALKKHTHQAFN